MENGAQMRISPAEIALIQGTYKGKDELLKLLRKIFLPEIDPQAPVGQVVDLWLANSQKFQELSAEECKVLMIARNMVIQHVEQQLSQLKYLANNDIPSPMQLEAKRKKDDTK